MSKTIEVHDEPMAEEVITVQTVEDVNDEAENAIGLGCGDDNPYR
ncbi:hypothetical protein ACH35V_06195 [Actinomadura sp. 1N219]